MEKVIKIILAVMLFLCLLDMPYGYYEFVRFIALVGFGFLAYKAKQRKSENEMIIYGGLALLFQPFFKVSLGRIIWNILDVIVGVGLIISVVMSRDKNSNKTWMWHIQIMFSTKTIFSNSNLLRNKINVSNHGIIAKFNYSDSVSTKYSLSAE